MVTTVTTTTVTTTTVIGATAALGVIATLLLIGLLVARELAGASESIRSIRWSRSLNIGVAPLLLAFAVIVAVKVSTSL
jgi:cytochrome c biogenesis protein CcdA